MVEEKDNTDSELVEEKDNTDNGLVEEKDNTDSELVEEKDNTDNELVEEIDDVEQVLIDIQELVPNAMTCKDLEMTPNDASKGSENYVKLLNAILAGYEIIVDDVYYVGRRTPLVNINTDLVLRGIPGKHCELIFNTTGNQFSPTGQDLIYIHDVKISVFGAVFPVLFRVNADAYIKNVDIQHCEFSGDMRLWNHIGSINANPESVIFGYDIFKFKHNKCRNIGMAFIRIVDVPHNEIIVEYNRINNFNYEFLNLGVENNHLYPDEIKRAKKLITVRHNIVITDDDYFFDGTTGLYHCFVLTEGMKTVYEHNYVEGLKTFKRYAVFDLYGSTEEVHYNNNTWINNLCLASDKINNELLRSKAASKRYYNNNKFVVDKDWVVAVGGDLANAWVTLFEATKFCEVIEVTGNTFDVYDLKLSSSGLQMFNVNFRDNIFNCERIDNILVNYRLVEGRDYSKSNVFITGNIINNLNNDGIPMLFQVVDNTDGASLINYVSIKDNHFKNFKPYVLSSPLVKNLEIKGNTFVNEVVGSLDYRGLFLGKVPTNGTITTENNIIETVSKFRTHYGLGGHFDHYADDKYSGILDPDSFRMLIKPYDKNTTTRNIHVELEIVSSEVQMKFAYGFTYGYDAGQDRNFVTFINSADKPVTVYLRNTGDDSHITGTTTALKLYDLSFSGGTAPNVRMLNWSSPHIDISGIPTGTFVNCHRKVTVSNNLLPPVKPVMVDTEPPTVAIVTPGHGSAVEGMVDIEVEANDNVGINRVEFLVNGLKVGVFEIAPYVCRWDTTGLAFGSHTLEAVAYDDAGNSGVSRIAVLKPEPEPEPQPQPEPETEPIPEPEPQSVQLVFTGSVGGKREGDFASHSFEVVKAGLVEATLSWNVSLTDLDLYMHTQGGKLLAVSRESDMSNLKESISLEIDKPGIYTLYVIAMSGKGKYELSLIKP